MKVVNATKQKDFIDVILEHTIAILIMAIIYKIAGFEITALVYLLGIFMNTKEKPTITITTMEKKPDAEHEAEHRTDDKE